MDLGAVMDEVATCMRQVAGLHAYAWPTGKVVPPAAVVSYPDNINYQVDRASYRISLPLVLAFGRPTDPATRDVLAAYANGSGPSSVRRLVDEYVWTSCDSVTATEADIDIVTVANVEYLAAVFTLDIIGSK